MSFEQKSLQYYSTSLDKLDELLELTREDYEKTQEFRDDLQEKLSYLDKGGELHEAIVGMSNALKSVISDGSLKVMITSSEAGQVESAGSTVGGVSVGATTVNTTTNISGGENFIISSIPDPSNFNNFVKVFPAAVKAMVKGLTDISKVEHGTIMKFNDFMLRLKKIGQDDEINKAIENLDTVSKNLLGFGKTVFQANLLFGVLGTSSAEKVGEWFKTLAKSADKNNIPDLAFLETVSGSLIGFGNRLLVASVLYGSKTTKGAENFSTTVTTILNALNEIEEKELKNKIESMSLLKKTILGFGFTMLLAAPLYVAAAAITSPAIAITLGAIGVAFRLFPSEKKTREVSRSLFFTALGITALAGSLVVWDRAPFDWEDVATSMVTIGVVGATFALIGTFDKRIESGAVAVGAFSLAILGFSLSLAASNAILGGDPISVLTTAGIMALTIGGFGIVFGLIGKFAPTILMGSLAVAAMGLSLLPIAFSLGMLMSVDYDWEKMAQFGVTLAGLGVIYAAAGTVSPLILAGSVAFGGVGLSLIALSKGLTDFMGVTSEDLSFFTEFENGNSGFTQLMTSLSEGASKAASFTAVAGAASMAAIGLALQALSKGIEPFVGTDNLFVQAINEDLGGTIATFLGSITDPFINLAKGVGDPSGSLMGKVFGADLGLTDAMQGAKSVASMGNALQAIADGVAPFVGSNNAITLALRPENNLGQNIGDFIKAITEPFIGVLGGEDVTSDSLVGKIFGADFSMSKAQEGAQAVAAMGNALQAISDGIKPFIGTDNAIVQAISPGNNLGQNIATFIGSLTDPFIAAGSGASSDSLMGLVFGNDFSLNTAEEGANSVKAMGDALKSISEGIKPFTGADNPMLQAINSGLGDTIAKFITTISQPFIDVMAGEEGRSSLLSKLIGTDFSISKAQEGAETVATMGEALLTISEGATNINNLMGKIDLQKYSDDVNTLVTSVPNAYMGITLPEDIQGGEDKLEFFEMTVEMVQKNIKQASKLDKVAKAYQSIAESFAGIATSTADIKDSVNDMKLEPMKEFSNLLTVSKDFLEEASDSNIESAIDNLGDQLTSTLSTIGSFFGGGDDEVQNPQGALTKADMMAFTKAIVNSLEAGNADVANAVRSMARRLDQTLKVREA